jgi:colanic acid/amylovoran biosynthesis glycosyltransferase
MEQPDAFPWPEIQVLPALAESRSAYLRPGTTVRAVRYRRQLTRSLRSCAVAHAHFGPEGVRAMDAARIAGVPLIVSFYGYDLTQLPAKFPVWRKRYAKLFERAEAVLIEGTHMRETLIELGCPASKAVVQRLGVDVGAIPFREHLLDGPLRLLLAASFREKKGIPYALEALARYREQALEATLTLIGEGPDEAEIMALIKTLGLEGAVETRPYVAYHELLEEFGRHHVLIQPSVTARDGDSEGGLPVTIIEAAAAGMPVLATRHCDIGDAIVDGSGGVLVPERDAVALAAGLRELAARHGEWPAMGAFNRERVTRLYDLETQARRLEEIYDGVRR